MKRTLVIIKTIILVMTVSLLNAQKKEPKVLIKTNYGNITIKLYNETPQHRDNFLKLARSGYFDSTIFHRVIKEFMIQGGDPDSKNAPAGAALGSGGPSYRIPAEILPTLFHKKGVLSAARQGDNVNPMKESSGSQFYIVQGRVYTVDELMQMEYGMMNQRLQQFFPKCIAKPQHNALRMKLDSLQKAGNKPALDMLSRELVEIMMKDPDFKPFQFTEAQKTAYSTIGGTPHLDGEYTVFGEVVEGLDVVDKIALMETDNRDRPKVNVVVTMVVIEE